MSNQGTISFQPGNKSGTVNLSALSSHYPGFGMQPVSTNKSYNSSQASIGLPGQSRGTVNMKSVYKSSVPKQRQSPPASEARSLSNGVAPIVSSYMVQDD